MTSPDPASYIIPPIKPWTNLALASSPHGRISNFINHGGFANLVWYDPLKEPLSAVPPGRTLSTIERALNTPSGLLESSELGKYESFDPLQMAKTHPHTIAEKHRVYIEHNPDTSSRAKFILEST